MSNQLEFVFTVDNARVQLVARQTQRMGIITRDDGSMALVVEVGHKWEAFEVSRGQLEDLITLTHLCGQGSVVATTGRSIEYLDDGATD